MIPRRILVKWLAAIAVGVAAFFLFSPWRAFVLLMAGRSTGCPLYLATNSRSAMEERAATIDRILRASRMATEDRPAGIELWETPQGRYWIPKGRTQALASQLANREQRVYETGEQSLALHYIVIDCGAKFGVFAREALEAGAAKVVAIEAAPENVTCLRRNLGAEIASGRVVLDTESSPVIDVLTRNLALERVDFIRVDVEGGDVAALAGARSTIGMYRPRIAIHPRAEADPEQITAVVRTGWRDYRTECGPCDERDFRIVPRTMWFF